MQPSETEAEQWLEAIRTCQHCVGVGHSHELLPHAPFVLYLYAFFPPQSKLWHTTLGARVCRVPDCIASVHSRHSVSCLSLVLTCWGTALLQSVSSSSSWLQSEQSCACSWAAPTADAGMVRGQDEDRTSQCSCSLQVNRSLRPDTTTQIL